MDKLTKKESRFVVEFVNGYDRYEAYKNAGYEAKTKQSMAAAVSRLLKRPRIKEAIAELEDAIEKSALVTPERIIANLAGIAFDESSNKPDRIRASELLGKNKRLWTDRIEQTGDGLQLNFTTVTEKEKTPEERREEIAEQNAG